MSDFSPDTPAPPSFLTQALASLARHGLNAAAGALGAAGVLTGDQQSAFVTVGLAVVLWCGNYVWSVIQKRNASKALKTAIAAPARPT